MHFKFHVACHVALQDSASSFRSTVGEFCRQGFRVYALFKVSNQGSSGKPMKFDGAAEAVEQGD